MARIFISTEFHRQRERLSAATFTPAFSLYHFDPQILIDDLMSKRLDHASAENAGDCEGWTRWHRSNSTSLEIESASFLIEFSVTNRPALKFQSTFPQHSQN
jgi:hypothetical protein